MYRSVPGGWRVEMLGVVSCFTTAERSCESSSDRCLSINKLAVEGLVERSLRKTLHAMGVTLKEIEKLRTLKLRDCVVRMCQVARASGLSFTTSGAEIWQRLSETGTDPPQPITRMFALYDMQILKAHSSDDQAKLASCLGQFHIDPSGRSGVWRDPGPHSRCADRRIRERQREGLSVVIAGGRWRSGAAIV
jgi:hypothetical protein